MIVDPSAATCAEPSSPGRPGATAGETLGKYRLDRVLGAGGMGIVWAAFDPDLERAVALKLLHSNDIPTLRTRLLREARAMARLKHPNVLTVYEVGTDRNRDYIAMEIVEGNTLDAWLATRPPVPEIVEALSAAGRGLAAAHAAGLVHRDFKPHNVLRSNDGHVYVTDFGLARGQIEDGPELVTAPLPALDLLSSPLTQTGVMIGTPAYMAPEQFLGKAPDARSDQFAFCITAWEALTGQRPFRGDSLPELQKATCGGVRDLPAADIAPRVREVLERGLDPEPDARWPDMRSLLDALVAALAPEPAQRARPRWIVVAAGSAVLIASGGIYLATRPPSPPPASGPAVVITTEAQCAAPDIAFGDAWSAERRDAVLKEHAGDDDLVAPMLLLDDLRRQWIEEYRTTCSNAKNPTRKVRLQCLTTLRDDIAKTTRNLDDPDSDMQLVQIVSLSSALGTCTGKKTFPFGELFTPVPPTEVVPPMPPPKRATWENTPESPEPFVPEPPSPPEPPRPPHDSKAR